MQRHDVYICGAQRTPIGRHGGCLSDVRPDDMAAHIINSILGATGVAPNAIEDVVFGCTNQAGEDCRNIARMALLLAGMPNEVAGTTINRLCGSGMDAVHVGSRSIMAGDAELIIAGGVESMSRAPLALSKAETPFQRGHSTVYDTMIGWRFPNPKMQERFPLEGLGETAETLSDIYTISREEQDQFAYTSQMKAKKAIEADIFTHEITSIRTSVAAGKACIVDRDEHPRLATTLATLSQLKPIFCARGTVTAGNSSGINDGAAALLLASAEAVRRHELTPMARIVSMAVAGVNPRTMGLGPVPATHKALQRAGLTVHDLDLVELNEAFAVQALACIHDLDLNVDRVNVNGGAIALGHPVGCSGTRILTTLVHEMQRRTNVRYGLATMCIGIGQGIATIVEKV